MEQRERFIADLKFGLFSVLELCARYGVSRKTVRISGHREREDRPS